MGTTVTLYNQRVVVAQLYLPVLASVKLSMCEAVVTHIFFL